MRVTRDMSSRHKIIIVLQVAQADYWFRAFLFSHDGVFRSSFRLRWIRQHEIARRPNATRVCQCRFRRVGLPRGHPAVDSPRTCPSRLFFRWAESSFLRRECSARRWGGSDLLVFHGALLSPSHLAKPLPQVRHFQPGLRFRLPS